MTKISSDDFKIYMKPKADCLTQHSSPAQPTQDEASSGATHRPGESPAWQPERSEGASAPDASTAQHAEGPHASAPFTPGPWRIDLHGEGPNRNKLFAIEAKDHYGIMRWVVDRVRGGNKQQTLANAHLIAAAPSLVDASMSTVERLADLPRFLRQNYNTVIAGIVEEELAKHAAAIAKATGGAA